MVIRFVKGRTAGASGALPTGPPLEALERILMASYGKFLQLCLTDFIGCRSSLGHGQVEILGNLHPRE